MNMSYRPNIVCRSFLFRHSPQRIDTRHPMMSLLHLRPSNPSRRMECSMRLSPQNPQHSSGHLGRFRIHHRKDRTDPQGTPHSHLRKQLIATHWPMHYTQTTRRWPMFPRRNLCIEMRPEANRFRHHIECTAFEDRSALSSSRLHTSGIGSGRQLRHNYQNYSLCNLRFHRPARHFPRGNRRTMLLPKKLPESTSRPRISGTMLRSDLIDNTRNRMHYNWLGLCCSPKVSIRQDTRGKHFGNKKTKRFVQY
jgi:hypothetical protein